MKRKIVKRIAAGVFFLALLAAFVLRAGYVLMPERTIYGAVWNMYLQEPEDSVDLLFFGSSMAYCDVIPATIYEETGLTSFVMAGPEQTMSITYDYMKETLKTQSPSMIFLELTGLLFDRYMNYTKANIGYMPYLSGNRLEATFRGAEPEERAGLLFPLYNYHDLWTGPAALFRPRADEKPDPMAGFTMMDTAEPQEAPVERAYETAEDVFAENVACLHKIQALCAEKGIQLVLFEIPSCAYVPEAWMARIREAAGPDAQIVDFNENFQGMGLDLETDFYDFLHCNVYGAVKFSRALSRYILETWDAAPHAHSAALWDWRVENLNRRLAGDWDEIPPPSGI